MCTHGSTWDHGGWRFGLFGRVQAVAWFAFWFSLGVIQWCACASVELFGCRFVQVLVGVFDRMLFMYP